MVNGPSGLGGAELEEGAMNRPELSYEPVKEDMIENELMMKQAEREDALYDLKSMLATMKNKWKGTPKS
eukprot:TRINITY_DN2978_c0_g1_i1.p1 TRINITY_DN2978_c0_g1~~TRINITY_DN2978_c0_g1_i1.p1  ORF type:complete len:80 (+),score=19.48 TRINITY_DN2978_c0_g1_i1:35-241(+)